MRKHKVVWQRWRTVTAIVAAVALGLVGSFSSGAIAQAAPTVAARGAALTCGRGWQLVLSPGLGTTGATLNGVAAVSANNVWAVGGYYPANSSQRTLIEQWNGRAWQVVPSPNLGPDDDWLNAVASVPGSSTVWAVGEAFTQGFATIDTLIERWNGTSWRIVPSPNPSSPFNELFGVAALSENDVWAVGVDSIGGGTLTEHWDGTSWHYVPSPNANNYDDFLLGVTAITANDVWAVGAYYLTNVTGDVTNALTEHWNGTSWQLVPNPVGYNYRLNAVTAIAANDVWAAGQPGIIERWNGRTWQVVPSAKAGTHDFFSGVAALSAHSVWAAGLYETTGIFTLVEQWNGSKWQATFTPNAAATNQLNAIARVPGTNSLWAVGTYTGSGGYTHPLTEARC